MFVCFCFVFLMLIVGEGGRLQSRIQAMQMRCYLKILRISYYQGGSLCQDPAGNRTTRRPNHRKETQTEVVLTCLPFTRTGQNHLARHCERGKKTRQTEEEVGRQHRGMDGPGVRQVSEGSGCLLYTSDAADDC